MKKFIFWTLTLIIVNIFMFTLSVIPWGLSATVSPWFVVLAIPGTVIGVLLSFKVCGELWDWIYFDWV